MKPPFLRSLSTAVVFSFALPSFVASTAWADTPVRGDKGDKDKSDKDKEEARLRFQHGVDLYKDGDYRAAVIEFKRAYEIAPNPKVLYNLGQSSLDAQDYPAALSAFRRYLDESGKDVTPQRRTQVEAELKKLEGRIARVVVRSNADDAEVLVDDVAVGRTPMASPLVVGTGRRKVAVIANGLQQTRTVDLASGDTTTVELLFAAPGAVAAATARSPAPSESTVSPKWPSPPVAPAPKRSASTGPWIGVVATSALAVGAGVTGVLALRAKTDFDATLDDGPASKADVDDARHRTRTWSITTDVLAGAAVVAGVATILSFALRSHDPGGAQVGVSMRPGGLGVDGRF